MPLRKKERRKDSKSSPRTGWFIGYFEFGWVVKQPDSKVQCYACLPLNSTTLINEYLHILYSYICN